jgi:hypothetical protein
VGSVPVIFLTSLAVWNQPIQENKETRLIDFMIDSFTMNEARDKANLVFIKHTESTNLNFSSSFINAYNTLMFFH